jgi:hypothetical protein
MPIVPDAPEALLDPALGPLVLDVVVSSSLGWDGFVRNNTLFNLLCLLFFQFSFILTSKRKTTLPAVTPHFKT